MGRQLLVFNKSFVQKGFAGMGFEICLEIQGFSFVWESTVPFKIPRVVFAGMGTVAAIVAIKA